MRKGGGKAKGGEFERKVCRALSLWLSNNKNEDLFWRSAMSGGRATVGHKKGKLLANQSGDISAIHEQGHRLTNVFSVECKTYKSLNLGGLFYGGKSGLVAFWNTVVIDAGKYSKLPMLIAKENGRPELICLDSIGARLLGLEGLKCVSDTGVGIYIYSFKDFLHLPPIGLLDVRPANKRPTPITKAS